MQTETIKLDPETARDLWRQYKKHQHYSEPIDREIQRAYQLIAQGRLVIRAIESIKVAGLNDEGLPKLAIARADAESCFFSPVDGGGEFTIGNRFSRRSNEAFGKTFDIPAGSWLDASNKRKRWRYEAILPIIPIHLRPKRGLQNYHVLWEAEWRRRVPVDPMLLRRIGRADMWLVVAAWELTEVERAALDHRING
jgi:hypothetical protein